MNFSGEEGLMESSDRSFSKTVTPDLEEVLIPYLCSRYTKGQFDRFAGYSEQAARERAHTLLPEYVESAVDKWKELGPIVEKYLGRKPRNILEVGSGIGHVPFMLSNVYPEARIVGCEVEPEAVAVARCLTLPQGNCNFILSGIEDLEYQNGVFDFVHCGQVIEHVVSPRRAIQRMIDLMAPGGVLCLQCPNYLFPYEPHANCWMLPGGPKSLVRLILRLRGQDTGFIDDVRMEVNIVRVKRWLRNAGRVEWLDLNDAKIDAVLVNGNGNGLRAPGVVSWIKRLGLAPLMAWTLRRLPFAPSVSLLVKKVG
jgi:SAM-dependent methyltransferase